MHIHKPHLHPVICAPMSWLQKKNQIICKGHFSFTFDVITEHQSCRDPAIKIFMNYISLSVCSMATNAFIS